MTATTMSVSISVKPAWRFRMGCGLLSWLHSRGGV